MRRIHGLLLVLVFTSCSGPQRYPAPLVKDIGRAPADEGPFPGAPGEPRQNPPFAGEPLSVGDGVQREDSAPGKNASGNSASGSRPALPAAVERTEGVTGFLKEFAGQIARCNLQDHPAFVVLPAFNFNRILNRYEVTLLGEDLAKEILGHVREKIGEKAVLVSPDQFRQEIVTSNRSLGDLDSPDSAAALAARIGARYVVRGLLEDSPSELSIQYEAVDVLDSSVLAEAKKTLSAGEPAARLLFQKHKDANGQPRLSQFRIGVLAPPVQISVNAEIQWIISQAVERLLLEAGPKLAGMPLAAPPTRLPSAFRFKKVQLAFQRGILAEKNFLLGTGLSEQQAVTRGPVQVLGRRFANLREAESFAAEVELAADISTGGELSSNLSRILFDELEKQGKKHQLDVIPHDQLVDEGVQFSRQEVERAKDGILDESTKEFLTTKGAKALLVSEFLESGDAYEFVFQIRRMDNLKPLGEQVRSVLEPRFAYELRKFLKK